MKKLVVIFALALTGSLGFVAAGYADKPPAPPGKNPCEHGNTGKPCKPDPNPDKGKDCEEHGKSGGVNENHCLDETQPPTNPPPTNPPPIQSPTNPSATLPSTPATTSDPGASPPATTTPVVDPTVTTTVTPPAGKLPKAKPKLKLPPKPRGVPKSAPPPCPVGQVYTARCAPQGSG